MTVLDDVSPAQSCSDLGPHHGPAESLYLGNLAFLLMPTWSPTSSSLVVSCVIIYSNIICYRWTWWQQPKWRSPQIWWYLDRGGDHEERNIWCCGYQDQDEYWQPVGPHCMLLKCSVFFRVCVCVCVSIVWIYNQHNIYFASLIYYQKKINHSNILSE